MSHVWLFNLVFFCSASTQTVLTCTVGSNRVQRSLAVEVLNHWTAYKDHASVSYVQFKGHKTHSRSYTCTCYKCMTSKLQTDEYYTPKASQIHEHESYYIHSYLSHQWLKSIASPCCSTPKWQVMKKSSCKYYVLFWMERTHVVNMRQWKVH